MILSTISRTFLSQLLTITLAETSIPIPPLPFSSSSSSSSSWRRIGPIVPPGTHHFNKFIKPEELVSFFRDDLKWASGKGKGMERSEVETRGVVYEPWKGSWRLMPRGAKWGELCNYYFGAKKPLEVVS